MTGLLQAGFSMPLCFSVLFCAFMLFLLSVHLVRVSCFFVAGGRLRASVFSRLFLFPSSVALSSPVLCGAGLQSRLYIAMQYKTPQDILVSAPFFLSFSAREQGRIAGLYRKDSTINSVRRCGGQNRIERYGTDTAVCWTKRTHQNPIRSVCRYRAAGLMVRSCMARCGLCWKKIYGLTVSQAQAPDRSMPRCYPMA